MKLQFKHFKTSSSPFILLSFLLGTHQIHGQDKTIEKRIASVEDRLETIDERLSRIENILFASIKFSESQARKDLKQAEAMLAQSERLHAQGLISAAQFQLDQMSVNRAETLLKMCVDHEDHRKIGATLDVLDAKLEYERLSLELTRTKELFEKGLSAKDHIIAGRTAVLLAGQKLKLAETKLKELEESVKQNDKNKRSEIKK